LVLAGASLFATTAAPLSYPQTEQLSLAMTETDTARPGVNVEAPVNAAPPAAERAPPANPLWAIPISRLSATRDRPLFTVSRRPIAPPVASSPESQMPTAVKPAPSTTPPFTLVGTIIGDKDRIAIFFDGSSKISIGVKEGESNSGWTLRSVSLRSAVVESSGRTVTLDLPEPEAQPPPQVPAGLKSPVLVR
jgi:general secretion pathway protein N